MHHHALRFIVLCFIATHVGLAQRTLSDQQIEELRAEITFLRAELDSLRQRISAISVERRAESTTEIDLLEERLEVRLGQLETKIDALSRASAPIILNPRTTAFINFATRVDSDPVLDVTGEHEISNRSFLRSVEIDFRNPVDPYAEAVLILAVESEGGSEFAVEPEEAYGLIKRLPIVETAPLGMKLRVGKFRPSLGQNNKSHMHDLPWTSRPLPVSRYLGSEHGDFFEGGYSATGMDVDLFLPNPIPRTTLEMNLGLSRAGDLGLSPGHDVTQPAFFGHLNLSADFENAHLLVLGLSGYREGGHIATSLFGVDFSYKWAPPERRASRSFLMGGEFFAGRHSTEDSLGVEDSQTPHGWFGYTQYQASYRTYLGLRYDWVREPFDDELVTRLISGYVSYYTTEFLRFRLGVEHRMSDIPALNKVTTGMFEVNFVFGSHPIEPYWVNR